MTYVETYHAGTIRSLTVPTSELRDVCAALRAHGVTITRSFPVR